MDICFAISEVDWELTKDLFDVVANIATALGVLAAGVIGWLGLITWRKQTKGTADHDLARRVLVAIYKYREAMIQYRSPVMWPSEMEPESGEEGAEGENFSVANFKATARGYSRRRRAVVQQRIELNALLLECEAAWDKSLTQMFALVFSLENEFTNYLQYYIRSINPDMEGKEQYTAILSKRRDILYDTGDDKGDEFRQELIEAISKMEQYLRAKMIR